MDPKHIVIGEKKKGEYVCLYVGDRGKDAESALEKAKKTCLSIRWLKSGTVWKRWEKPGLRMTVRTVSPRKKGAASKSKKPSGKPKNTPKKDAAEQKAPEEGAPKKDAAEQKAPEEGAPKKDAAEQKAPEEGAPKKDAAEQKAPEECAPEKES